MGATLIFPSCVPQAHAYAERARQRGEPIVAASSLAYDETSTKFATWFHLPNVHDGDFLARLDDAIVAHGIERIYCPVLSAHLVLRQLRDDGKLSVPLVGEIPTLGHDREHHDLMHVAADRHALIQSIVDGRSPLTVFDVAGVLRQALGILGESDDVKMTAMMAIFAEAPRGDVVEIGVLAGRSACVLAMMARRHHTGAVLAVDSWTVAEALQRDANPRFREAIDAYGAVAHERFLRTCFDSFVVSLLPIAAEGRFNYLALPSRQAHAVWSSERSVETPHFGPVDYCGTISVLHIDGNHDFASVREDCALWLPHLAPGGWLILDDYVWDHGDGPRRVGDALLAEHAATMARAFVCGKALFMKLG